MGFETLHRELEDRNQSAAGSLAEGLDETLTLHRLGLYGVLGRNRPDEPLRIRVEIRTPGWETDRVDTAASENLLEDPRVQRIAVVNQMV